MANELVQVLDVEKRYRNGKRKVPALNGIKLSVKKGEILGIVGPSGSGKTTLLNLIGGLGRPSNGKIVVDGKDLSDLGNRELTDFRLQKIGFIFQFYNLIPTLNATENVALPMSLASVKKPERDNRARELLRVVGMGPRMDHLPNQLSGGEQQRVAVARALANNPPLILGDEPTGDLDSTAAKKLVELIRSLRKDTRITFIIVTHDPLVVAGCDRVCSIRDGKISKEFTQSELDHYRNSSRDSMEDLLM